MKDTEARLHQKLQRVAQFGTIHTADFPANSKGATLFATVAGAVKQVNDNAAMQVSGKGTAKTGTDLKALCADILHEDLVAISRTAHALAQTIPRLDDKFRLPRNFGQGVLLNTARAFATDAAPLEAQFVAYEMPADFLQQFNNHIKAMEDAMATQNTGKETKVSATAGIGQNLQPALLAAQALDAIVRNKYRNDPATLAEWTTANHTERGPHHSKTTPALAPTPQAAVK